VRMKVEYPLSITILLNHMLLKLIEHLLFEWVFGLWVVLSVVTRVTKRFFLLIAM